MYSDLSLLALIPARAGSKGLANKNILDCAGKPLIGWTIAAAKAVPPIDDVLVSTDSMEIAEVARKAGASVPFLRPLELATDNASLRDAIRHAWENHTTSTGKRYDYLVILQPTSPLRTEAHISEAIEFYFKNRQSADDSLVSVYQVNQKFGWLMQNADNSKYIQFCMDVNSQNPQRQKLEPFFLPNGAIFIVKGSALEQGIYRKNTLPFVMPAEYSIDIDTVDDFAEAEAILIRRQGTAHSTIQSNS